MSLLGTAALAMWWEIAPEVKPDFEDWHAHEHFPERLGIPGFKRGTRCSSATGGEGMFVMYELEDYEVLSSPAYLARLNAPTPWSTRLMPHHRNMVRCQCHVLESQGGCIARHVLTMRLSPAAGKAEELRTFLASFIEKSARQPGMTGAHLLKHQTPDIPATTEQKIRNSADRVADWIFVVCGYDFDVIERLISEDLAPPALAAAGAEPGAVSGLYSLSYSVVPRDCGKGL